MNTFENLNTNSDNNSPTESDNSMNGGEKLNSIEKLPSPVYYVESTNDKTVLVGIDATIERSADLASENAIAVVSWFDTSHRREMLASEIGKKGELFAFRRAEQEGVAFMYLSQ